MFLIVETVALTSGISTPEFGVNCILSESTKSSDFSFASKMRPLGLYSDTGLVDKLSWEYS